MLGLPGSRVEQNLSELGRVLLGCKPEIFKIVYRLVMDVFQAHFQILGVLELRVCVIVDQDWFALELDG